MKCPNRSGLYLLFSGVLALVLTAIGIGLAFFASHHESQPVTEQSAAVTFAQLRSQFPAGSALLEMSRAQPLDELGTAPSLAALHTFHTVIFDTRAGGRLVEIHVPYWFARLFAGREGEFHWLGQLTFLDDTEFDGESIQLTLEQLEQRGPGLIVDYTHPGGGQFLSWVE